MYDNQFVSENQFARNMMKTYGWMFIGLLTTALAAFATLQYVITTQNASILTGVPRMVLIFAELGLVIYLSRRIMNMSSGKATLFFLLYAALNGITLSTIFLAYSTRAIMFTFGYTAFAFGAMSIYGYVTKSDLTKTGNLMMFGLIGVIIVSVVNIFLRSSMLEWIVSFAGVAIFLGLTAYDTQKIKNINSSLVASGKSQNIAIICALNLYLDFINLLLFMLRIFGRND